MMGQSQYLISLYPSFGSNLCSAELHHNNVTGTNYKLYVLNGDERQELATILYVCKFHFTSYFQKLFLYI